MGNTSPVNTRQPYMQSMRLHVTTVERKLQRHMKREHKGTCEDFSVGDTRKLKTNRPAFPTLPFDEMSRSQYNLRSRCGTSFNAPVNPPSVRRTGPARPRRAGNVNKNENNVNGNVRMLIRSCIGLIAVLILVPAIKLGSLSEQSDHSIQGKTRTGKMMARTQVANNTKCRSILKH